MTVEECFHLIEKKNDISWSNHQLDNVWEEEKCSLDDLSKIKYSIYFKGE